MQVRLWVLVEVLWSCEALLIDNVRGTNAQGILGEQLLAASAVGGDVDDVDLVSLIEVVRSPAFTIVGCIQSLCACVDTCRDENNREWLVDLFGRRQLLDVKLVAPHLLAWNARVDVTTTNVKGISMVCRFLAATFWADGLETTAISVACTVRAILC
jgi:hypothetical protein